MNGVPRAQTVFQIFFSLLRSRAARAVLWTLAVFWVFDRFVYFTTETQWYASAGMTPLWWARSRAQTELFLGFAFLGLLLAQLFLGPVSKIAPAQKRLRGKLARYDALRGRISRFSWALIFVVVLWEAHRFTQLWPEWLLLRGGAAVNYRYLGLSASLWTHWLPILGPLLQALWWFSWLLLFLTAATGVLRALPELAVRRPAPPLVLARTLWIFAAWLLILRALIDGQRILDLARGRALETGDVYVSAPIYAFGALACLLLALSALRRAIKAQLRQKMSRPVIAMLIAIWLPGMINWLSAPERSLLPETAWLKRVRQNATIAAWQLNFDTARDKPANIVAELAWPVWNEPIALQALGGPGFRDKKVVTWESATLGFAGKGWHALAAAQSAGATAMTAGRDADDAALTFERLDFPVQGNSIVRTPLPLHKAYFGVEGRSLFTDENVGVSIASMGNKWLWAWRLRDILLPFDGVNSSHLLVYRGAVERAERIAPFFKAMGEPELVANGNSPLWMIDLGAVSTNFPGSMPAASGELRGLNALSDSFKMLVDARSGVVSIFALPAAEGDLLLGPIRKAYASSLRDADKMPGDLQTKWQAAPAALEAQLALWSELKEGDSSSRSQTIPAQIGLGAVGGLVSRVVAIRKNSFESLEAPLGLRGERLLRHGDFDLGARLTAIEQAVAKTPLPAGKSLVAGQPFVWPDPNASGGYSIGRGFFLVPQEKVSAENADPGVHLWRAALTGVAADARVSVGESVRSAALDALGMSPAGGARVPLAVQALRAHNAAQAALKVSNWAVFKSESEKARKILEQLAAQSAAN